MSALGTAGPDALAQDAKKPVNSENDLPRYTYPVSGTAWSLITADPATFDAFAAPVRRDLEATLSGYDIKDHATLRELLGEKLALQLLSGTQDADALATLAQLRAVEDKPDAKLLSGLKPQAIVKARAQAGRSSGPAYTSAFESAYAALIGALPYAAVRNSIGQQKSSLELASARLYEGGIKTNLEPAVAKTHTVSDVNAAAIIGTRYALLISLPLKDPSLRVLQRFIAANTVKKPDIWAARDAALTSSMPLTPVTMAIWDSGVDVSLFASQLFTDAQPSQYDAHGLAFDLLGLPAHGNLLPLTPQQLALYPEYRGYLQGFSDLEQSIDSPAAAAVKQKIASLPPDQAPAFFENVELFAQYAHGTHVAGIAARGNPAARLLVGRITFDYKNVPTAPTEELVRRSAADYAKYVEYFKAHGVRVVNMSWGGGPRDYEEALEKNGMGKDAAARKTLARHYFEIDRDGLYAALRSAPGILFVAAAGNANGDSSFDDQIPAGFDLPNLLVVSAVDSAGDEASFTSYGPTVKVDANGYEVESFVPGGERLQFSGTSMASPNVANLAGKLLALDPALTPAQVIELIRSGATTSADGRRHLIDERHSLQLLAAMTKKAS